MALNQEYLFGTSQHETELSKNRSRVKGEGSIRPSQVDILKEGMEWKTWPGNGRQGLGMEDVA
jgi:hypothetical protein